jgi:hypothetical protein
MGPSTVHAIIEVLLLHSISRSQIARWYLAGLKSSNRRERELAAEMTAPFHPSSWPDHHQRLQCICATFVSPLGSGRARGSTEGSDVSPITGARLRGCPRYDRPSFACGTWTKCSLRARLDFALRKSERVMLKRTGSDLRPTVSLRIRGA